MQLDKISDIHMIDRNKAQGRAYLSMEEHIVWADFVFYLQGLDCLGIRLGRHDPAAETQELEDFILQHKAEIRYMIKEDIIIMRQKQKGNE